MRRLLIAFGLSLVMPMLALCQTPHRIAIRAGKLIDGKSEKPLENVLIVIEGDKIASVVAGGSGSAGVDVIDLSKATVLPGFIDTHTHVLLQGYITKEEYDAQLLKESIPYRAILAARNAQIALSHGFTAIRDLETEGAMYADVDVKTAIANGEWSRPCARRGREWGAGARGWASRRCRERPGLGITPTAATTLKATACSTRW